MGQCCRGCCDQSACAALDSARYNMDDKHCLVRINRVHVLEKLFVATSRVSNMRSIFSLFSSDLAIDLGTANTLVFAQVRASSSTSLPSSP